MIFYDHKKRLLTYFLSPWCRVLLEKLTGLQLVKKFPAFHGTRRFIIALTSVRHLSLSWANPIQSIYPHPTSWRCILILSTHPPYEALWKIKCNKVVLSYILYNYSYTDCILVTRHPGDGHRSDRNMLVKNNNIKLNIFVEVHLVAYQVSTNLQDPEYCPLLGYYAASSGDSLSMFRDNLSVPSTRVENEINRPSVSPLYFWDIPIYSYSLVYPALKKEAFVRILCFVDRASW